MFEENYDDVLEESVETQVTVNNKSEEKSTTNTKVVGAICFGSGILAGIAGVFGGIALRRKIKKAKEERLKNSEK